MLIHTCTVERDAQTVKGAYNVKKAPSWQVHADTVSCRFTPQISNVRGMGGVVGEGSPFNLRDFVKRVVTFMFPATLSITEQDRIIDVKDRTGAVVDPGPFNVILSKPSFRNSRPHHTSVIAERTI